MDENFSEIEFPSVSVVSSPCSRMVHRPVRVRMGSVFVALQKRVVRTLGIGGSEEGERVSGRRVNRGGKRVNRGGARGRRVNRGGRSAEELGG